MYSTPRKRSFRLVAPMALLVILLLTGCTHQYAPQKYPLQEGAAAGLNRVGAVDVVNGQTATGLVLLGVQGAHKWMGDLHEWTETAVQLTSDELRKRGGRTGPGAPATLTLQVTRANLYWGFASIRCILHLKATTGEGYVREFEGNNSSPWTLYRACDGAVTRTVAAMLEDPEIINYLKP